MPSSNHFRHQDYVAELPDVDVEYLSVAAPLSPDCDEFRDRLAAVGEQLRRARVAAIVLVHGSFVGSDAMGVARKLARVSPTIGQAVAEMQKRWLDLWAGDAGNYASDYAATLQAALGGDNVPIVRRVNWSSENHHVGRAAGAVQLLDELHQLDANGERILICGHSHGGNVFALVSNLLGGDSHCRDQFFEAARSYYRLPLLGRVDFPIWLEVRDQIEKSTLSDRWRLDFVTLGTPVRYGWDSGGYDRLLHIVNHRPQPGLAAHLGRVPESIEDVMQGRGGDYIQMWGIAGTNFAPSGWAFRARAADRRLHRLVQDGHRRRDLLKRLRLGVRVHDEGRTLLVDYGDAAGRVAEHIAGHAVYTRRDLMCFHLEQIVRQLYSSP
ncbi:MAG: hypothetical protein QGG36_01755 [Pirellulaceae bacterium]|jgi:hypothetical protein|nr:hypothetical protein [Pirellulaceae bacterium]MDP7014503.1 hypothetical protein [Pirellulaceae bacterium]